MNSVGGPRIDSESDSFAGSETAADPLSDMASASDIFTDSEIGDGPFADPRADPLTDSETAAGTFADSKHVTGVHNN